MRSVAVGFGARLKGSLAQGLRFHSRLKQDNEEEEGRATGKVRCNEDQAPVEGRVGRRGRSGPDWSQMSESGQQWGLVCKKGRGPTGVGPTNGNDGRKGLRAARRNGRPYVKDSRYVALGGRWRGAS